MDGKTEKIVIILFGMSQTGKSSFINHISRKYLCKVFNIGTGQSCTGEASCYGPLKTRTGDEVLLVDTQGLNDYRPEFHDSGIKSRLTEYIIKQFIDQIEVFNPDRIIFGVTESVTGDTIQFLKNLTHLMDLFGKKAM